jgi:hypothetical protein
VSNLGFDAAGNLYVYESGTSDSKGEPTVVRFTSAANGFSPPPTTESLVAFPIYFGGATGFAAD